MFGALIILFGLCLGSFANVCIHRLPRYESIVAPRSHCAACGRPIEPRDLIPVVSYLLLRGKCRHCGARISPRNPLIEIVTGLLFVAAYGLLGLTWQLIVAWVTVIVGVVAFFADMDTRIIPNGLTLPGIAAGLILAVASGRLVSSLLGLLVCGGAFLIIGLLGAGKMGGGDIKLAAAIGAILGIKAGATAMFLGIVTGALVGLVLVILRRATLKSYIPYAPPLAAAAVGVALFWPYLEPAIRAYLGW